AGFNVRNRSLKSNAGTYVVKMTHGEEGQRTGAEVIGQIQGMIAAAREGAGLADVGPAVPGLGVSGSVSIHSEEQLAGDIKNFQAAVFKFLGSANPRPEIGMDYTLFNANTPNYQLTVNRDQDKKMGVSVGTIYSTISSYLGSAYIN